MISRTKGNALCKLWISKVLFSKRFCKVSARSMTPQTVIVQKVRFTDPEFILLRRQIRSALKTLYFRREQLCINNVMCS